MRLREPSVGVAFATILVFVIIGALFVGIGVAFGGDEPLNPAPTSRPALRDVVQAQARRIDTLARRLEDVKANERADRENIANLHAFISTCLSQFAPITLNADGVYVDADPSDPNAIWVLVAPAACG